MAPRLQLILQPHLLLEQLIITLSYRSMQYRTWTCTTTQRARGPSSTAPPPTSPLVGTADHNSILQEYAVQNLDLYYDTESQWPLVYSSSSNLTSCRDKESVLQVQKIMEKGCIEGNPGTDSEAYLQHRTIYCHNRTDEEGTWLIVKKYRHLFYMFIQCQCLILAWKLNKEAIGSSWTLDFSLYILPQ